MHVQLNTHLAHKGSSFTLRVSTSLCLFYTTLLLIIILQMIVFYEKKWSTESSFGMLYSSSSKNK